MKLLIAEDRVTLRLMLQVIVSQWGFDPVLAEDGTRGLGYFKRLIPTPSNIVRLGKAQNGWPRSMPTRACYRS